MMMRPYKLAMASVATLFLFIVLQTGCGMGDRGAASNIDEWYRLHSAEQLGDDHRAWRDPPVPLDPDSINKDSSIHPVIETSRKEAVARLADQPVIALNETEAKELTGMALERPDDRQPFLLRAVALGDARSGGFTGFWHDGVLAIHYGTLGKRPRPMVKQPVVVWLTEPPQALVLSVSMAE